jgi:hypothetical protein
MTKNQYAEIRKALSALGINKSVAGNTTYDGIPCVTVRWNGAEEHVNLLRVEDDENTEYIEWLKSTYADINLK